MKEQHRRRSVWISALMGILPGVLPLSACQICFPIPKESAADHLLSADRVVLARENPGKPFSLKMTEVLKGAGEGPEIDLFLDSATRRLLKIHPERAVVCAHRESEPGDKWLRVGIVDELFGSLVREILDRAPQWEDAPAERPAFFAPYLGHDDPQLRQLAHIEVARAPYNEIRDLGSILSREEIHAFLANFRYIEWHALYILLLAQSGNEEDRQLIAEHVRSAGRFGSTNQLAAWTTAWIEVDEVAALDFLEERYFGNPGRSEEEMQALLMTLSVHGNNGHVHLRDRIVENYRLILASHPALARGIVGDLTNWQRWDLAGAVAAIVADQDEVLEPTTRQLMRNYVQRANDSLGGVLQEPSGDGNSLLTWAVIALVLVPVVLAVVSRRGKGRGPSEHKSHS